MANENEQEYNDSQRRSADATGAATKKAEQLTEALQDLINSADLQDSILKRTNRGFNSLERAIASGRKRWADVGDDLAALADDIAALEDVTERKAKQDDLDLLAQKARGAQFTKLITDASAELAAGAAKIYMAVGRSAISSYQSNASAFQMAGDAAIAGIDAGNQTAQGFSKVLGATGLALSAIPGAGWAVAGALEVVAAGISVFSAQMSDLAKFGVQVSTKELENAVNSYRRAATVGALFADGLQELRDSGAQALLTQDQFSKVVSENVNGLAMFGGTVSAGVKQFTLINGSMDKYRKGLLSLGYSIEDIAQGTADYMSLLALSGQGNRRDYANLAKETDAYLTNLKAISAFSGEDVKKMQARAREASTQAAVQAKLAGMDKDARARFEASVEGLPPILQKAVQQMFATGTITDTDLAAALAQMPAGMELVNKAVGYASDSTLKFGDVTTKMQEDIKNLSPELQKQANAAGSTIGTATLLTGQYAELSKVIESLQQLSIKGMGQQEKSTKDLVDKTKESTDKLTQAFTDAEVQAQNLKISIQTALTPAIYEFADTAKSILTGIQKQVNNLFGPKPAGAGGQVIGGTVVGGAGSEGDAGAIIAAQEGTLPPSTITPSGPLGQGRVPTSPGAALPGNLSTNYSGINLKGNESVAGGGADPVLLDALRAVTAKYPNVMVTGINDSFHLGKAGSKHPLGKAADFVFPGITKEKAQDMLAGISAVMSGVKAEFHPKGYKGANADHIHAEMANGGNLGPGETAIVGERGPEIVQGSGSVTSTAATSRVFNDMLGKLDEMVRVMRDHKDISEDLLHASV
jgi:uncharacterized membrane protein (Fun14 family)